MGVECPYCDYSGMVSSVEAHISGMSDEAHSGKVGRGFREDLPQVEDLSQDEEESSGVPVPVSPSVVLIGVMVLLVVALVLASSSTAEEPEESDQMGGF